MLPSAANLADYLACPLPTSLPRLSLQAEKESVVKEIEKDKKDIKAGQAKLAGQDVALGDYAKVCPPFAPPSLWSGCDEDRRS